MLDIPGAASYYFYVVGSKDIQGSLSHIPSQHHVDPHLLQFSCYVGLASASWGRRNNLVTHNLIVLPYCQDRVILTVTEMVVNHVFSGRNCNFHHNLFFLLMLSTYSVHAIFVSYGFISGTFRGHPLMQRPHLIQSG